MKTVCISRFATVYVRVDARAFIPRILPKMRFCFASILLLLLSVHAFGATFGSVVVIGGHASDLALDERRGQLYIANFAGRRIDVMSTADNTLRTPISMTTVGESGSLALSPDNRYLLVTNYANCTPAGTAGGPCSFLTSSNTPLLTILDLDANLRTVLPIPQPSPATTPRVPLAIAFGKGSRALLITSSALFLVDPQAGTFQQLPNPQVTITSSPLPVTFGTFPPQILQASTGVSGDGQTVFVLAQGTQPQAATATTPAVAGNQLVLRYDVFSGAVDATTITSSPALGPRVISANRDGSAVLAGWSLLDADIDLLAQFPYPTGVLNLGAHAWDYSRNLIYAQIPSGGPTDPPVLTVADSDNLTVRERIQLPENLGGRSVFNSDLSILYAISDSGVTVLPVGSLAASPRVSTLEEQLLFQATSCDNGTIKRTLNVVDLSGRRTDFTLSVPAGTNGIKIGQSSGSTPAQVTIEIDPTAFRGQTGTTVVPLSVQSNGSVGIASPVRLLVNTKDPDQRGIIHSLPGKIVDIAADPVRGRLYAVRQDRNQVIVIDGTSFNVLATLRTGNTPTKVAFTRDNRFLMVANDNSQIANVFDLDTLQPSQPILFPPGHYPRAIAVSNSTMFAVVRNAGTPSGLIDQIDFNNRVASTPPTLGIFTNAVPPDSVVTASPSGNSVFFALSDGTVFLFDDAFQAFEASRKDLGSLAGSYAALSDNLFLAGGILFNRSMVQIGPLPNTSAASSILASSNGALTINADSPPAPGIVERASITRVTLEHLRSIEAPVTKAFLTTPVVGQIGQTLLSFLQTVAPANNGAIVYLSVSGFTELPANFDLAVAVPSIFSLVNSADGGAAAPGSLITITGSTLASTSASAGSLPLPTALGEICATVNGVPLPLISVSPGKIAGQLPYEVSGSASLVIIAPGGKSAPFRFTAPATALAVFRNGQAGDLTGLPLIYRASNAQLLDFSNPVHPGDTLIIIATGLGQTSPAAVSGAAAPADPLERALAVPTVSIGGAALDVPFAGLMPGMVGVYQINAVVPHGIPGNPQVPLVIQQNSSSTTFIVRVVNP